MFIDKHFSRGDGVNHVPLHELERQVLNMPVVPAPPYETGLMMDGKGNIVENPDYRRVTGVAGTDRMYYEQPTATVEIKHDLSVKWYGAQFHASDYRLIVDWLNEIGAVDCKISQFNNIVSGAMFFVLAAIQEEK